METKKLLRALSRAIEAEKNIGTEMLLIYSKESIKRMSKDLKDTAEILSNQTNFHALSDTLKKSAAGE